MGRAKEAMMEDENNLGLIEFLEELITRDELEGTVAGITKQVIAKGVNSMSDKQKAVIDKFVEKYKLDYECDICLNGNINRLTDYFNVMEKGVCPMCEYDREKFMRD